MKFISTRDSSNCVNFETAVCKCMPADGGLYVPYDSPDLRRWILYTDDTTSFANVAGSLTSACISEEFSPIICEAIATYSFNFEPKVTKYTDRFYTLELCYTPTGSHKDFGVSYLINSLEYMLLLQNKKAIFVDVTIGELGASMARAMRGKQNLKAVLIYPKGKIRGLSDSDFVWNGGNIYPVEVDGNEHDCHQMMRQIFADKDFVEKYNLTVANTANPGRLMPQMFFYPYAFSKLKKDVTGDIFYAMAPGNYSNLVCGLYSWRLALPVKGFICPTTDELILDLQNQCSVFDGMVPFEKREIADPASPSNLERLEDVFHNNSLMLKNLLFPAKVSEEDICNACRELFMKYNIYADRNTSQAYAAAIARQDLIDDEESAVVLVVRDHPALASDYIKHNTGEEPQMPDNIREALTPVKLNRPMITCVEQIIDIIKSVQ